MDKKKTVLVTTTTFPRWRDDTEPGFIFELCKGISKKYDVIVLAPHFKGAKKHEFLDGIEVFRYRYFFPSSLQKLCYNGGILGNIKKNPILSLFLMPSLLFNQFFLIRKLLKSGKIDLLHAHWLIPQGWIASLLRRFYGIKYTVTAHGSDVSLLKNNFFRGFGKNAIKNSELLTYNSKYNKKLIDSVIFKKKSILIPMGVDIDKFSKDKKFDLFKKFGIKGKIVLFVGRLTEQKGVKFLISAINLLKNEFQVINLVIVGDGPEKRNLIKLAGKLGVKNRVKFTGPVAKEELASYYHSSDVFVLPSVKREGLGVVLLEAMASEVAVVGSNVGGIPEVIEDGETGILVKDESSKAIADGISRILSDKALKSKLVKNGKKFVQDNYSWKDICERFTKLYDKVIDDGKD